MLKIREKISFPFHFYYPEFLKTSEDAVAFFDIETTGFSPLSSNLYLIGCLSKEEECWYLTQWFSDSFSSELELLESFFSFLTNKNCLIHFNGDAFDIPYITKCASQYGLSFPILLRSFDIYKEIKPLKKILSLPNLKQKSVEQFLNLKRNDLYDGGQLIPIYKEYIRTHDETLLNLLLLHNKEDVLQMPKLLPILHYKAFEQEAFSLCDIHTEKNSLFLTAKLSLSLPKPFQYENNSMLLNGEGSLLHVRFPILDQELKYFYSDYKNYFYLPDEDTAIHKKVAQFVDKSHRKPATHSTCYVRRHDLYIPNPNAKIFPAFTSEYKSPLSFTLYQKDSVFLTNYLKEHFKNLYHKA